MSQTEDVGIVAPSDVFFEFWEAFRGGAPKFSIEPDGKIAYDTSQDFRVRIDIVIFGDKNTCIDTIYVTDNLLGGSAASKSSLLRVRAKTVVERGSNGEADDLRWLLAQPNMMRQSYRVYFHDFLPRRRVSKPTHGKFGQVHPYTNLLNPPHCLKLFFFF